MTKFTDEDGMVLDFEWPSGPGSSDSKPKIRITAPNGEVRLNFTLERGFAGQIRQTLERMIQASGRSKTFKG